MNRAGCRVFVLWAFILAVGCSSQPTPQDLVGEADQSSQPHLEVSQEDAAVDQAGEIDRSSTDQLEETGPDYQPVVFAVVSDLHVNGSYSSAIPQNVVKLLTHAAAMAPTPEFIAVTGDLTDTLHEPVDLGPGSRMEALQQIFDGAQVPLEAVLGNHDYYLQDHPQFLLVQDRAARDQLFREQLSIQPWYYTTHGGMRFIYLNTMQGPLWNISIGLNGSAGAEQLAWLDGLLSEGIPSVLFMHHPPSTVIEEDETTLTSVLQAHKENVLAVFAGHVHLWVRSTDGGIPVYLTKAGYDGTGVHHVRVDPMARTVEILNESEIDYGEPTPSECNPAELAPLANPSALEGTYLELLISDAVAEPAGIGTYLEEAVKMIPFVMRVGAPDPSGKAIAGHLAMGAWVGSSPVATKYVAALTDGPCLQIGYLLDSPCFETSPVAVTFDLAKSLGIGLPAGHQIRVTLRDLSFLGAFTDAPSIAQGVMHAKVDLNEGVADLKNLLMEQYCDGKISGCQPGSSEKFPVCPSTLDETLFASIPTSCDVKVGMIGVRMVLGLMKTVPGYMATMDAHYTTWKATESQTSQIGAIDPDLFYCVQR